ncbi:MAG: YjcQ family protein [Coriobacteriales bacterium]|nr:YjcQ family protein [Coriobacteriales bacterium]
MAYDDFDVIVYKTLSYIYACLKQGVYPNMDKAQELTRCNDVYWLQVICSLLKDGLIQGVSISAYKASAVQQIIATSPGITQAGARYLKENSKMAEVCEFLGKAFEHRLGREFLSAIFCHQ